MLSSSGLPAPVHQTLDQQSKRYRNNPKVCLPRSSDVFKTQRPSERAVSRRVPGRSRGCSELSDAGDGHRRACRQQQKMAAASSAPEDGPHARAQGSAPSIHRIDRRKQHAQQALPREREELLYTRPASVRRCMDVLVVTL